MAAKRRAIWGWMLFDWASQPYYTLIVTFIFAPYFAASVAATPAEGQALWGYATGAAAAVIALTAPVLGAVADASGPRKPWIAVFSAFYVAGAAALWLAAPGGDGIVWILVAFAIGLIGAEFTTVFINSMLPGLGTQAEIGRISGSGWALGYWGGLVSLAIVLGLMAPMGEAGVTLLGVAPIFGLDPAAGEGARATGPLTALWYLVFVIPFFLFTPDSPRNPKARGAAMAGLRQLRATLAGLPKRRSLFAYLAGSMFYRDALGGLYVFGGIYAAGVLGWTTFQLGVFGIVAAAAGAVGSWAGGLWDAARGPRPVIMGAILALTAVTALVISTGRGEVLFLDVGAASSLPTLAFYLCGAVIGAAGGALQASSRTMLVALAEPGRMAEAFGIYALAGKATSFLAPFAIAVTTSAFDSQRIGVAPVFVLFAAGFALMLFVAPGRRGGHVAGAGA